MQIDRTEALEVNTELISEIERYLAAVAVFRAEGHEPEWRDDGAAGFVDDAAAADAACVSTAPEVR